jgi:hypothetical protein
MPGFGWEAPPGASATTARMAGSTLHVLSTAQASAAIARHQSVWTRFELISAFKAHSHQP